MVAVTPYGDTALLAVCDGVGGLSAGELASYSAVRWITQWFENSYPELLKSFHSSTDELFNRVELDFSSSLQMLNLALRKHGRNTGTELGTTVTAILFFGGSYIICHVGDCRVYRFERNGNMSILTDDQTWVAREVVRGNITPEQARSHPKKNIILQSVGTQKELEPVFSRGEYATGDVYMVCCDGFRNEIFDDELSDAFGQLGYGDEQDLYEACKTIAHAVMGRNEYDNISAVAMSVQDGVDYDFTMGAALQNTPAKSPISVYVEDELEDAEPTTNLDEDDYEANAHPDLDAFSDMTIVFESEGGE